MNLMVTVPLDTARDFRILVAEDALNKLEDIIKYHRLNLPINWNRVYNIIRETKSCLLKIKYSYLPSKNLSKTNEIKNLQNYSIELARHLLDKQLIQKFRPDPYNLAIVRYCLRIIYGLKYRLMLSDDNKPFYAIDIEGVKIVNVYRHPKAEKLYITKAEGLFPYTIITNIETIRKGEVRAAAILPPLIIRGELSEAMYCSDPIPAKYKGKRPPEKLINTSEINSIIYTIVSRIQK